uniref:Leucine-rich repeat-containing N-terminal plant-type domain-containing protein n=1 Tax=Aegilops tauschii subsp. strangulata TaxID=200361 RepID=A0A453FSZ3_AEGTS
MVSQSFVFLIGLIGRKLPSFEDKSLTEWPLAVAALQALMKNWRNQPQSWTGSDPCKPWDGISCSSGRVTEMLELNLSVVIFYFFYQETIR